MKKSLLAVGAALWSVMAWAATPTEEVVAPLCKATVAWNQTGALNAKIHYDRNYPCGCDMLAWGQVLTYHGLLHGAPDASWKPTPETWPVMLFKSLNDWPPTEEARTTSGQTYDWAEVRDQGPDASQLMYDLGVLGRAAYRPGLTSGTLSRKDIKRYFGYEGQGWLYTSPHYHVDVNQATQREPNWKEMIVQQVRASLHAGAPLVVSLMTATGGHMVVCDGYGYAADGTLLFHFHYGWGSTSGVWYPASWWWNVGGNDQLQTVNVNVHPKDLGCVLAGRVTAAGKPLAEVEVTLQTGESVKTDATGSYCFTGLPPNTTYTLTAVSARYETVSATVTTGLWRDDELRGQAQTDWENTHGKEDAYHVPLAGGNVIVDFVLPMPKVYVTATGTGDGTTWEAAAGLTKTFLETVPASTQVCVASGNYTVTEMLTVPAGVTLMGGFNAETGARNVYGTPTTITMGTGARGYPPSFIFEAKSDAVVDGFVLVNNYQDWSNGTAQGGTIKNCIFTGNREYVVQDATLQCCIMRNTAATQEGCSLIHCTFYGEVPAGKEGGGTVAGCLAMATTDYPAANLIGTCSCGQCPENGLNGNALEKTPGALSTSVQGYSIYLN